MTTKYLLLAATAVLVPTAAWAAEGDAKETLESAGTGVRKPATSLMTTGVARARDRLDSATSTSTLDAEAIEKLGPRSLAEIFRAIPGMRAESTNGEGFANISIRGLPIALGGAKFLQIQENGLPTLEFGDIGLATADQFLRADLGLAGVQAIRGGSASTFASNSPGGIVNLIDKTGETVGGAIQATLGLDYDTRRIDFEYGAPVSEGLHFHVGGFYRKGEGARETGFDGFKGGQVKLNVTREFEGGFIRIFAKYLNDQTVPTPFTAIRISGTDADPKYTNLPGVDAMRDTPFSRYIPASLTLDDENELARHSFSEATHSKVNSIGFEAKVDVDEWTINNKFRYARISGSTIQPYAFSNATAQLPFRSMGPAPFIMGMLRATNIAYASGPNAGQAITDPTALNGNGLLAIMNSEDATFNSLDNTINDLRVSKMFDVGAGKLTFTAGFYKSRQDMDTAWTWTTFLSDVAGNGSAHLIDAFAGPVALTQGGFVAYGSPFIGGARRDRYDLHYDVNAPYGSLNYQIGQIALGASVRYDFGGAKGTIWGTSLPNTPKFISYDVNGDGVISIPESRTGAIPYGQPGKVDYDYHYLSYSLSVNYRPAESFSTFARYSKGARANADRILFANYVSPATGKLLVPAAAYDPVQQAELGVKYRTGSVETYITGFWAKTAEHNISLDRSYRAYGAELEASWRSGSLSVTGGATWTKAEITRDALRPATVGNTPKHQADLIFQLSPQVELGKVTFGGTAYGTTGAFTADSNQLRMPGYVIVNAFVQVRPLDRVTVMINANNLLDTLGLVEVNEDFLPTTGVGSVRTINPRTVSASVRFDL